MPKKYDNEIKVEIYLLKAHGLGLTEIWQHVQKRREKISMTEGYSSNLDKLEQEIAIQKLERSIPSDPSIRKWIDEFNDLRDVDKYKMEQISEEWDGFTMPEGVPISATESLMQYKQWFKHIPMEKQYADYFNSYVFSKELVRWIYIVLSTIPKYVEIVDWEDRRIKTDDAFPYLYVVEKHEILLWSEKLMYFDLAARFLGDKKPRGILETIAGGVYMGMATQVDKYWKSRIYEALKLEELAYAHETKARGEYLPYWLEKDEENEEKFLKWYEDNYFSKENKNLMDKTINEYREYQVLTSWQNSSWSDLEEYDDVIED